MFLFTQKTRKKDYRNKIARHILNGFCKNKFNQIIKKEQFKKKSKDSLKI